MHGAVAIRQQGLERQAVHLPRAVAEHRFGTWIDLRDAARAVDHDHAVGSGFEQPAVQVAHDGAEASRRTSAVHT